MKSLVICCFEMVNQQRGKFLGKNCLYNWTAEISSNIHAHVCRTRINEMIGRLLSEVFSHLNWKHWL